VFEQVLQRCIEAGLIGGEGFAVDASVVKADASRQRHHEDDDDDWGGGSRAINEYLDALHEDGSSIAPPTPPKKVSQTDPLARWTSAPGGPAYYAYSTNYLVDTKAGVIVDVEATPANRAQEVASTKTMIERVKDRFGVETKRLIGDTAYGTRSSTPERAATFPSIYQPSGLPEFVIKTRYFCDDSVTSIAYLFDHAPKRGFSTVQRMSELTFKGASTCE
jgi:hypothetical protein